MARVTLCMIVRDEASMLPDCLSSVRGVVDEMVIVDTGSRDASVAIARAAGADVFEMAWSDDFAAARNEALRHAHGDWVLQLDADERLGPGAGRALRRGLVKAKFDCGMLRLHDADRVDAAPEEVISGKARQAEVQLVPRLLRHADGLFYVDAIHENVMPWLRRRGSRVGAVDVDIVHLGATKELVGARAKIERNIRLLRARIALNEADATAYGYLAHDCMRAGKLDTALEVANTGWEYVLKGIETGTSIHRLATARAYLLIGRRDFAEAREVVRVARLREGDNPDFAFFDGYASESEALEAGDVTTRRTLLRAAKDKYTQCVRFRGRVFAQSFVVGASGWYGLTRLGTVEVQLGHPCESLRAFEAALSIRPNERAARLGRAEATMEGGKAPAALFLLEDLLDKTPDAWILSALCVQTMGRRADAHLFAAKARSLLGNGLIAPHRRERLREFPVANVAHFDSGSLATSEGHR